MYSIDDFITYFEEFNSYSASEIAMRSLLGWMLASLPYAEIGHNKVALYARGHRDLGYDFNLSIDDLLRDETVSLWLNDYRARNILLFKELDYTEEV